MRRVVVTGLGIVSSIGSNAEEVTDSLRHARSGIVTADDYVRLGFRSQIHGSLKIDLDTVLDLAPGLLGKPQQRMRDALLDLLGRHLGDAGMALLQPVADGLQRVGRKLGKAGDQPWPGRRGPVPARSGAATRYGKEGHAPPAAVARMLRKTCTWIPRHLVQNMEKGVTCGWRTPETGPQAMGGRKITEGSSDV